MLVRNGRRFGRLWLVGKPFLRFLWLTLGCGNWRFGIKGYVWSMLHSGAEFCAGASLGVAERPAAIHPAPSLWTPDVDIKTNCNPLLAFAAGR